MNGGQSFPRLGIASLRITADKNVYRTPYGLWTLSNKTVLKDDAGSSS
jgi:hypothetical protein